MALTRKEIDRRYYLRHAEKLKGEAIERYAKSGRKRGVMTPEQKRLAAIAQIEWRVANPEKYKAQRIKHSIRQKELTLLMKKKVLNHYGNGKLVCAICGESRLACLSIDHIDGGGRKHLASIKRFGGSFYRWLEEQSFPEGYQTLCMNCQWVKRFENGESRGNNA